MTTVEILAGIEADLNNDKKSDVRLTPLHVPVDVPDAVADILIASLSMLDSRDVQPGDGEYDFPVTKAMVEKMGLPSWITDAIKGSQNAFLKVRRKKA